LGVEFIISTISSISGIDSISSTGDLRIDIRFRSGDSLIHKQIERKNGMTFMRLKKRAFE
jgi:hypothetical protein